MFKRLVLFLFLLAPLFSGGFKHQTHANMPLLLEKSLKRSTESDDFISYWKEDFRKDETGEIIPICDITYASYTEMYSRYVVLSNEDREIVNKTPDYEEGYTIEDSVKELIRIHSNHTGTKESEKRTLNQSSTIIIIVVIAVFGMSTICVFFVLKNSKIIK